MENFGIRGYKVPTNLKQKPVKNPIVKYYKNQNTKSYMNDVIARSKG